MMSVFMDAENTWQVNDWLWTSGQLSERDISRLPLLNIAAVINLAMPTSSNALRGEAELITGRGMDYFHIPVVWEAPQLEQLLTFFNILDALKGRKVWVHCAKNMRVSAFIYLYRKLRLQEPEELAIFPMQVIWAPNETWQKFINDAIASKSIQLDEY
jgi:protein tyrosine phosphatase (PTP) superfamily phosphohydrolase (DUF442 family)